MSGTLLSRGFLRGSLTRTGSRVLPAVARTDPYRSHRRSIFDTSFADAPSTMSTTASISLARTTGKRELKVEAATVAAAPAALTFTLTPAHGYVALSVVFAVFVHNIYMNVGVARARKKFDVPYPTLYADGDSESANTFNCVQRGHQNSLEGYAGFLALLLVAGVKFPLTAAISGVVYSLGKVLYFNGYSTGDPNKRLQGAFSYFGLFTLLGCVTRFGLSLILSA